MHYLKKVIYLCFFIMLPFNGLATEKSISIENLEKQFFLNHKMFYGPLEIENLQNLGALYFYGSKKTPRDYNKSIRIFKFLSNKNNKYSQYGLGLMYYNGLGTEVDYQKAFYYYKAAAENNHIDAQVALGRMYRKNNEKTGIPKNHKEAYKWYMRAAKYGHGKAMVFLGNMYFLGQGRDFNLVKGLMWNYLAQMSGEKMGINLIKTFEKDLSETNQLSLKTAKLAAIKCKINKYEKC